MFVSACSTGHALELGCPCGLCPCSSGCLLVDMCGHFGECPGTLISDWVEECSYSFKDVRPQRGVIPPGHSSLGRAMGSWVPCPLRQGVLSRKASQPLYPSAWVYCHTQLHKGPFGGKTYSALVVLNSSVCPNPCLPHFPSVSGGRELTHPFTFPL